MPPKTSIVLCTGAWHNETHLQPSLPLLQSLNYTPIPCALASANRQGGWDEDVKAIEASTRSELGKGNTVALVLHSAAGPPGCEAVNRILATRDGSEPGKIVKMVFVASFVTDEERDAVATNMASRGYLRFGTGEDKGAIFAEKGHEAMLNDMSPEDAKPYIVALGGQVAGVKLGVTGEKWKEVSATYLLCERDNVAPPDVQEGVAKNHVMGLRRIDASHDPFISQPEKFARVVDEILKS
ncbi:uncharacterized protein LTR77_008439 [Saxophila tyrrhenica]|uniref:AB hydrolase-1 domain-containing protein n=1 Tax=Saxophila tyrrhenica TaxID=1690608 RepID=A0AAV9P1I0_9PEZI|nr:hypothetical protein LTR77_008439 [Saxophila tyrrhenica]